MSEFGFYRLPQVLEIIPTNRCAWYAGIRAGIFPQPVRISKRSVAWKKDEVHALAARMAEGQVEFDRVRE